MQGAVLYAAIAVVVIVLIVVVYYYMLLTQPSPQPLPTPTPTLSTITSTTSTFGSSGAICNGKTFSQTGTQGLYTTSDGTASLILSTRLTPNTQYNGQTGTFPANPSAPPTVAFCVADVGEIPTQPDQYTWFGRGVACLSGMTASGSLNQYKWVNNLGNAWTLPCA